MQRSGEGEVRAGARLGALVPWSHHQPVLEAEDTAEQKKIPVSTQFRQDPEQARKH